MRKILFRGKRADNGEWVEGYLTKRPSAIQVGNSSPWYIDVPPKDPDDNGGTHNVIPETVGQFTGFTDKNGKMIFEGDIVKYSETITTRSRGTETLKGVYKVVYDFCGFSPFDCIATHHCEVIGNIHDNPELLKEDAKQ